MSMVITFSFFDASPHLVIVGGLHEVITLSAGEGAAGV
jgi:hypothetical protein